MSDCLTYTKKRFCATFNIPLDRQPITCEIADASLSAKLFENNLILAFGKYDLVFCFQKENENDYETSLTSRSFCEKLALTETTDQLPPGIIINAYFSQPLRIHTQVARPSNLTIWELIKNIFSSAIRVEVKVEGEIAAEVVRVKSEAGEPAAATDKQTGPDREASVEQDKQVDQGEPVLKTNDQPAINLEALAELVMKVIEKYEKEKVSLKEPAKILPEREQPFRERTYAARTQAGASQPVPGTSTGVVIPPPSFYSGQLAQVSSRPGLFKSFIRQPMPPPKPADAGG